jgi:hypothetical protein
MDIKAMDDGNNKTGDLAVARQSCLLLIASFCFFPIQYILEIIIHSKCKL